MHLHHDAVPSAEGVIQVGHGEIHFGHLAWRECLGLLPAVAELSAHRLTAKKLLVTSHAQRRRIDHPLARRAACVRVGIVIRIDIDQLHHEIGIGARGRDFQLWRDRTGNRDVFRQRLGLVDEHVGPCRGEALVVDHVALWNCVGYISNEGYGMRRIAHIGVGAFARSRRIERQLAAGVEVEHARFGLRRRPRIVLAPHIRAGFEYVGFRHLRALVLQVVLEERELNILAEVFAVFELKCTSPRWSPSLRAHPPCTQGPSTMVFTVPGLFFSIA